MQEIVPLLWIVAIAAVFWLLIIRPAQRRQREMARLQSSIAVGEQVVLTSGVFGTVTEAADTHVMVEIAPGVAIKVVRGAIGSVVTDDAAGNDAATPGGTSASGPDETTEER